MGSVSTIHGNLNCIIYDTTCQKGLNKIILNCEHIGNNVALDKLIH